MQQLLPTASIRAADQPITIVEAHQDLDDLSFLDGRGDRQQISKYLSTSQSDCFAVMKDEKLVYDWFGGFGAPRVSGGLCITVHDLLRIGQMACDGGTVVGEQIVLKIWIDDIYSHHDNHIWLQQQGGQGPRLFLNGNYRSQWCRPYQNAQIACAIGIYGQWLWVDRAAGLVMVKMALNDTVVDTNTDRALLAAFAAIEAALG